MSLVGYARVSTAGQSLDVQLEQLAAAGCDKVFSEKQSAKSVKGRPALAEALDWVREGDGLMVTRLDRLARSLADLHKIIGRLADKGVSFQCLQQSVIDTYTHDGRLMLNILGAFAEFENGLRRERQAEGIARAKAEGRRVYGRGATIDPAAIEAELARGLGPAAVARKLKIARSSVYRVADSLKPKEP